MLDIQTAADWRGNELVDRDGDRIGTITDIYVDRESDVPEWATVKTGLFGLRQTFVPIRDATTHEDIVRVPFEKSHVKDAPNVDPDGELDQAAERELYDHYGIDWSKDRSGAQLPERGAAPGQEPVEQSAQGQDRGEAPGQQGRDRGDAPGQQGQGPGDRPDRNVGDPSAAQPGRQWSDGPGGGEGPTEGRPPEASSIAEETSADERPEQDEPDTPGDDERDADRSPTPEEGERGVAVPGESDDDERDERDERAERADEPEGETVARLRLKRYVVTEEVKVPVRREEIRLEPDES